MEQKAMAETAVQAQELRVRAGYYQLLARLFYQEIDEAFAAQFVEAQPVLALDECADDIERSFARGNNRMRKFLQRRTADSITETRCDYARVFLGAGSVTKVPVSPFESVYADEGRLIMQASRGGACAAYATEGMAVSDGFNMPEDHISFEFQYMALLLNRCADALEAMQSEGQVAAADAAQAQAEAYRGKAWAFFVAHLAPWVPLFCEEAADLAQTSFYQGLLEATAAWMALECAQMAVDGAAVQKDVRALAFEARAKAATQQEALHGQCKEVA